MPTFPSGPGWEVSSEHDEYVDYEDWMEPACMFEQALRSGLAINVIDWVDTLEFGVQQPILRIDGAPCRDFILAGHKSGDALSRKYVDLGWPSMRGHAAQFYGETSTFVKNAGRDVYLADMVGETFGDPRPNYWAGMRGEAAPVASIALGDAMQKFAGSQCYVKQLYPAKSLPVHSFDVPKDASAKDAEGLFVDYCGMHFARFEGERGCMSVQQAKIMTHETRFFVLDGEIVCGAACIESDTPQMSDGTLLAPRFEIKRNSGEIVTDEPAAQILLDAARRISQEFSEECPDLKAYVLDLALDETRSPLMIELNPAAQSGLYGIDAPRLFQAIHRFAETIEPRNAETDPLPEPRAGMPPRNRLKSLAALQGQDPGGVWEDEDVVDGDIMLSFD